MSKASYILAIDQGTTSSRAIVFDREGVPLATSQKELTQFHPEQAWVEHSPAEIWRASLETARRATDKAGIGATAIAAIGIANQRETIVLWNRSTGEAIYRAIVWQDRRTAALCASLQEDKLEPFIQERTGLLLDPYFSASKISWILDNIEGARETAERGELAVGTIDSFLIWHLTGGNVHATDATNASRTMLFNIHTQDWDDDLLRIFRIPRNLLPEICNSGGLIGYTDPRLFGHPIPICGAAGDQQAALFGQACFEPGQVKATFGTGGFMLMNTGTRIVRSQARLITTLAYQLDGKPTYALEGSFFVAGAAVKWLRDKLRLIADVADTSSLAMQVDDRHGVYIVPGFVGLGAPHWKPDARGLICGLTLDSSPAHIARAALESVAFQTLDLADAMARDDANSPKSLRIDGGMVMNDWLCQFLADIVDTDVERAANIETTAQGAAYLAGLGCGLWASTADIQRKWQRDVLFRPKMKKTDRTPIIAGWRKATRMALGEA